MSDQIESVDLDTYRLQSGSVLLLSPKRPLAQLQREKIREALSSQIPDEVTTVLLPHALDVITLDDVAERINSAQQEKNAPKTASERLAEQYDS